MPYLCISHSSRPMDYARCSRPFLQERYAASDRLRNPAPLDSLPPESSQQYLCNLTVWNLTNAEEKPELLLFVKMDYQAQQALVMEENLIICGTAFVEIRSFKTQKIIRHISHPWFAGAHTVFADSKSRWAVSCSSSDAILFFDRQSGRFTQALQMPAHLYGRGYDLKPSDDLRQHYIPNDLQRTHLNCAYPTNKGYLVTTLIQGAIGLFNNNGQYKEIVSGYVGAHGARTRKDLDGFYFADSCSGNLMEMSWEGRKIRQFGVSSRWLHDCHWLERDVYLFSMSDANCAEAWDIKRSNRLWSLDMGGFGATVQFLSVSGNAADNPINPDNLPKNT